MKRTEVVVFLLNLDNTQVLLGRKMKKIGSGKWNGYGGGVKKKESFREATVRELKKELGVIANPEDFIEQGFLEITLVKNVLAYDKHRLHIFILKKWEGDFIDSSEMKEPTWFSIKDLPELISSDFLWVPYVLQGKKVEGSLRNNLILRTLDVSICITY